MRSAFKALTYTILVHAFIALAASSAGAMSVSPVQLEMTTAGAGGRAQIVAHNDSNQPMPVEAVIQRLTLDENGQQKRSDGSAQFLVFPPQALIPPGGSQVFPVNREGEPLIAKSESFMLTLTQIPVKVKSPRNLVQVVMGFGVVINVAPPRGTPSLRLVSAGVTSGPKGERQPTVTVENPSNVHALLPQSTIRLAANGWSKTLTPAELDQKLGIGLVQPGKRRRFVLPISLPPNVRDLRATLEFKPQRR
jgi:P pilus assembly chaperone PapD